MDTENEIPTVDEIIARMLPPLSYEGHSVVESNGVLVWMRQEDIGPNDLLCFYDGDCREVLKPTDLHLQKNIK